MKSEWRRVEVRGGGWKWVKGERRWGEVGGGVCKV